MLARRPALRRPAPERDRLLRPSVVRGECEDPMANGIILFGDIGATNARFGLFAQDALGPVEWMPAAEFAHFSDAVEAFLDRRDRPALAGALLAVAGPVEANRATMTNRGWVIDGAELCRQFRLRWARILNDFEAVAWSLPHLGARDLHRIGAGTAVPGKPLAVLGPGSGLGVAGYIPAGGGTVMPSEGGHATLPGSSAREDRVIQHLRERFGHVSCERAVSGPGLENLYAAIAAIDGMQVPGRDAPEITRAGLDGSCATSRAALEMFCAFLGTIAGDMALAYGARGGVFIAGGIVPRILEFLERSEFRARFAAKGRMRAYLEQIPTSVIIHSDATFVGLQALAEQDGK
jgi:glucokinase